MVKLAGGLAIDQSGGQSIRRRHSPQQTVLRANSGELYPQSRNLEV